MTYNPNYPVSADVLANPTTLTNRDDVGFELHGVISRIQDILEALEAKLGIGASVPGATAAVLRRTATGASAWGQLADVDVGAGTIGLTKLVPGSSGVVKSNGSAISAGNVIVSGDVSTGGVNTGALRAIGGGLAGFGAIQTADIAAGAVTQIATIAVPGQSATGTSANNMTGGALSITTQGGPVLLLYGSRADFVASAAVSNLQVWENVAFLATLFGNGLSPTVSQSRMGHVLLAAPSAGTHSYQLAWYTDISVQQNTGGGTFTAIEFKR